VIKKKKVAGGAEPNESRVSFWGLGVNPNPNPRISLYTMLPSSILYGVLHKRVESVGRRILRNGRAIVMQ